MAFGLTLAGIRTLLRAHIDDPQADRLSDVALNILINVAQLEIQEEMDIAADQPFFVACQNYSVVAATDTIEFPLPENFSTAILAERITATRPIPGEYVDFRARHSQQPSSGLPWPFSAIAPGLVPSFAWSLRTTKFEVIAPAETFTARLWYGYVLADLSADTDYSEIPAKFRPLIALHAAKLTKGEQSDRGGGLPKDLQDVYERGLDRLRVWVEQRRQKQQPQYVQYLGD